MTEDKEIFHKERHEFLRLWHSYHAKLKIPYSHDEADKIFNSLCLIFKEDTMDKKFTVSTFVPKHFKFNENATLKEVIEILNLICMTANDEETYNKLKKYKWLTFEEAQDDRE